MRGYKGTIRSTVGRHRWLPTPGQDGSMRQTLTTYKDMHFEEIGQMYSEKIVEMFVVDTSKEDAAKLRFRHRSIYVFTIPTS